MDSIEGKKALNKMQQEILKNGIDHEALSAELKKIRPIALQEEKPRLVRAMRMTYEHLDAYEGFFIGMPTDVDFDDEDENKEVTIEMTDVEDDPKGQQESLNYLFSLMSDSTNTGNAEELKLYIEALKEYAENN